VLVIEVTSEVESEASKARTKTFLALGDANLIISWERTRGEIRRAIIFRKHTPPIECRELIRGRSSGFCATVSIPVLAGLLVEDLVFLARSMAFRYLARRLREDSRIVVGAP
jgi:hypothetical protein